ncbi:H-X9-DG-CTERM domain-containing protein [Sphingobacterium faecium]
MNTFFKKHFLYCDGHTKFVSSYNGKFYCFCS